MKKIDLGKDNISTLFLKYAIPSVISTIIFSIYVVIDGIFVGRVVGPSGLAAVNIAMPIFSLSFALGLMVSVGGNTVTSIELGEGDKTKARNTFSMGFYSLMIISITISILIIIFKKSIGLALGASTEILPQVIQYLVILCIFLPAFNGGSYLATGLRTMGKPNFSMLCSVLGAVLNIVLDYIFVVKFNWGVAGAAFASGIAFFISFIVSLIVIQHKDSILKLTRCKFDLRKIGRFFYNGSSEALTEVAFAFTTFIFNIVLMKRMGEMGVSAFSIIQYIATIVVAVFLGISNGITPIISYNYGAGNGDRIKKIIKLTFKIISVLGIICTSALFFGGETLISLFIDNDPVLLETTAWGSKIYSLAFLISGINILASSYFTALEDAKTSVIISSLRGIVFITIGLMILPQVFGDAGVWGTVLFSEALTVIITFVLVKKSYKNLVKIEV